MTIAVDWDVQPQIKLIKHTSILCIMQAVKKLAKLHVYPMFTGILTNNFDLWAHTSKIQNLT